MSNHLLREHAPVSDSNWKLLDEEARERLGVLLAARKLVDFAGPHGWEYSATNLGRVAPVAKAPCDGVVALQRRVLPLVEVRALFAISRDELRDDDRGCLRVLLERQTLLIPADCLGLLRQGCAQPGEGTSRGRQLLRRLVILVETHLLSCGRWGGLTRYPSACEAS